MVKIENVLVGAKHTSIEEAILADIVSSIPILGTVTDIVRVGKSIEQNSTRRIAAQVADLLVSPIPVVNLFTPTNSLLYLDDKKQLPISLKEIDKITGAGSGK